MNEILLQVTDRAAHTQYHGILYKSDSYTLLIDVFMNSRTVHAFLSIIDIAIDFTIWF